MLSIPDFVSKWRASTRTERSSAQEHFLDICRLMGHPTPAEVDPSGESFTFEKGLSKSSGGQGYADVWKLGAFAWEYKGRHKNLESAYNQLLMYKDALQNPPLFIVCDFDTFVVHTNFTNTVKREYRFTPEDLIANVPTPRCAIPPLEVMRAIFYDQPRLRQDYTTAQVTERAATEFALLAESLHKRGHDPEEAARFLMRLLFCLFAEDTNLLPQELFTRLVEKTRIRPDEFNRRVRQLFDAMSHKDSSFGEHDIAYFNGGLFNSDEALPLTSGDLEVLARASRLDWASIEPAIFGTLFERSLDPSKRSQLGAHYTSREDILLIVEPVLMEPLRRRWSEVRDEAEVIVKKMNATEGRAGRTKPQREQDRATLTRLQQTLEKLLSSFADEIARMTVLDPACGSGNFLYVALKRLLDLEKEVSIFAATNRLPAMFPKVDPSQLYGIEVNVYAHELASIVVWIGYIQWLRSNGFGTPSSPILKPLSNIRQMDAILAYDAEGRPVEPEWPQAEVIIGNPPFLGGTKMRGELGNLYVSDLRALYSGKLPPAADLVCYWFERSRQQISKGLSNRCGLLATQGIRGDENRKVLERIKGTGDIFMAWSDRNWVLNGAAVRISIIGFDDGSEKDRTLDGSQVTHINANLTGDKDFALAQPLLENKNLCFAGTKKVGPFELDAVSASAMLHAKGNPNGRPNSDVVRPRVNGADLTRRSSNTWIIDFGIESSAEKASQYEMPFEYVRQFVLPFRESARSEDLLTIPWWIHQRPRPEMRAALSPLDRFIGTPLTAKHRVFVWLAHPTLPDQGVFVFARADDYFFGILHSRLHELWVLRMGTALEDRPRYTPTTSTFEAFPFPYPPGKEPHADPRVEAIAQAARELVEKRDAWLNPPGAAPDDLKKRTLTNLYNARPTWLSNAHRKLDVAVLDAYGWPNDLGDEEMLERLLALNLERAQG